MAAEASAGGDQALGVLLEELPVHAGLVVVALEECLARELDEVAIADLVLGEHDEVVVELVATLGFAAGVVDTASAGGALRPVLMGHVGLGADDRLDPLLLALLVELEGAVHVAVIGHRDRRLAVGDRLGHHLVEARGPVEHREFGVDVEVYERVGHGSCGVVVWSGELQRRDSRTYHASGRLRNGPPRRIPAIQAAATGTATPVSTAMPAAERRRPGARESVAAGTGRLPVRSSRPAPGCDPRSWRRRGTDRRGRPGRAPTRRRRAAKAVGSSCRRRW